MKFEIDLNDIFIDPNNPEPIEDILRREIVERFTAIMRKGIVQKLDEAISQKIGEILKESVATRMPALMDDILDYEYYTVDRYGSRSKEPTTFKKELIKTITEQLVYKRAQYDDQKNVFTRAVDTAIAEHMKLIAKEYKETVDEAIGKKAFELAIETLQKKLGLV